MATISLSTMATAITTEVSAAARSQLLTLPFQLALSVYQASTEV